VNGVGAGSFVTAPESTAAAVKLFAYGDTRSQPGVQNAVVGRMMGTYAADPAFQTLALHVGDWVGSDDESAWTSEFFNLSYANLTSFRTSVPIMGCRGNHEGGGPIYGKYYPYPYVAGFYWSFDYGPVHVAILDQYTAYTPGSAQYAWLTNDLATTVKPWKFLVFHEPGWSAGGNGNNSTVQTHLQPVCKTYNVPIVFAGHDHLYAQCAVNGVQHLTVGGGGAPLHSVGTGYPNVVVAESTYHHAEITLNGRVLSGQVLRTNGSVLDTFTITNPPVTTLATCYRATRMGLKIITAELVASHAHDPLGRPLWVTSVGVCTNGGTVSMDTDRIFYTPPASDADDAFTYTVSDGLDGSTIGTVCVAKIRLGGLAQLIGTTGGNVLLKFAGIPSYQYDVERSTNLTAWTVLCTTNAPDNGQFSYSDRSPPTPQAYYRLRAY
jgi:hypothetical protein